MARALFKAKRSLRRFARAKEGATVVEFALVAIPFFLLMVGLAEVSMIGFAQTSLDFAVSDTARTIRTGRVQTDGVSEGEVKQALCDELTELMVLSCDNLYLDIKDYPSFVDIDTVNPVEDGNFSPTGFGYEPGAPSAIVVVRAYYNWEIITPFFKSLFANVSSGDRLLVSTMMFRNEPYQ